MTVLEKAIAGGVEAAKDKRSGQLNLFADLEDEAMPATVALPDMPEYPEKERLAMEKEVLGYYLSSHPLAEYELTLRSFCTANAVTAKNLKHRTEVWMGGVISSIKLAHTRNPKPDTPSKYANFDLEDLEGITRAIAWPNTYERFADVIQADAIVLARGRIDKRGEEEFNLIIDEVLPMAEVDAKFTSGIRIRFDEEKHSQELIPRIAEILRGYPGEREVHFDLKVESGETIVVVSRKHRVSINQELRERLDDLLGLDSHRLIFTKPSLNQSNGNGEYPRRRSS
jgi:DNA polymerase-3 subunit alpha